MDHNFKFFHSVDPRKIPCKIKSKFAKLTLSSKKTKPVEKVRQETPVSRKSAGTNSLLTDDESDKEETGAAAASTQINKLLLSESLKSSENENVAEVSDIAGKLQLSESDEETYCSLEDMEKLEVSAGENEENQPCSPGTSNAIAQLSQQISCMGLANPNSVAVSSDSAEASQIISRESQQRSSSSNIYPKLELKSPDSSIYTVSSAESTPEKSAAQPTDNQTSDSEEDDDEIITLSDSDEDKTEDYENRVSDSRPSGQTSLASTISNAKADHILAFLRDVEKSQKKAKIACDDTQSMHESVLLKGFEPSMNEEIEEVISVLPVEPNPVSIADTQSFNASVQSSIPETSLTVPETSSDNIISPADEPSAKHDPSSKNSTVDSLNESTLSVENINISAKINIKIQFSKQIVQPVSGTSSSDGTDGSENDDDPPPDTNQSQSQESIQKDKSVTTNSNTEDSSNHKKSSSRPNVANISQKEFTEKATLHQSVQKDKSVTTNSNTEDSSNHKKSSSRPNVANISQEEFTEKATLLTKIYGDAWKTPDVVKTLQRSVCVENTTANIPEDSVLHDFSMFRENVPNGLESTRLHNSPKKDTFKCPVSKTTKSGRIVKQRLHNLTEIDSDEESKTKKPTRNRLKKNRSKDNTSYDKLVYLDLTKEEVEVMKDISESPPANHDKDFKERLDKLFDNFRLDDDGNKQTPVAPKTKRKLFTPIYGSDHEAELPIHSPRKPYISSSDEEKENIKISDPLPARYDPINKQLESVKTGKPIFKIRTPQSSAKKKEFPKFPIDTETEKHPAKTPVSDKKVKSLKTPSSSSKKNLRIITEIANTPSDKYGFLKSLDVCVPRSQCHPDALFYRDHYKHKKDELAQNLFHIYNKNCFDNKLTVPLVWNKKLINTAGRCTNKRKSGVRMSVIDLSEKVLTSCDRLRCTLIHELCHAATWIINEEHGHGAVWKAWAEKANSVFPSLPKIGICHQYDIEYKYTYKCTLCGVKSHAHSKSKKVDKIRCAFCHGAIEIFLNKKDKDGNVIHTPVREAKGFAKFVQEKYQQFKKSHLTHADTMKLLSSAYAELNAAERLQY